MYKSIPNKLLIISGLTLFFLLLVRNYQINTKTSAAGESVAVSFIPQTYTNINPGDPVVAKIHANPNVAFAVAGYYVKVAFDNTRLQVSDIKYDLGKLNVGLGDENAYKAEINARGAIYLGGEDPSGNGIILPAGTDTLTATVTFTFAASSATGTSVVIIPAESEFDKLNSDYTLSKIPVTATNALAINGGVPTIPAGSGIRYVQCDLCGFCQRFGVPESVPQRWEACRKCLYPDTGNSSATDMKTLLITGDNNEGPTPKPGRQYTFLGCVGTNLTSFSATGAAASPVQIILNFIFAAAGGLSLLFFLYGSYIILTSRANPDRLRYGKKILYGSIIGLVFTLSSVFIVNLIASGALKIPGF